VLPSLKQTFEEKQIKEQHKKSNSGNKYAPTPASTHLFMR